jgi:hypothetical protein
MSRIQDGQFDQMMEEESDNWQRQLQEDEEYAAWLDLMNKQQSNGLVNTQEKAA